MSETAITKQPQAGAGCQASTDIPEDYRILVIGKTGNGKSTVCNTILGQNDFLTGSSMSSVTLKMQVATTTLSDGRVIKVVDTSDVTADNSQEKTDGVSKWKEATKPEPSAVLVAIRCDCRYTAEEYAIYKDIKEQWGDSLCHRLIVAFTFGDRQDTDIKTDLKKACRELKCVLKDAKDRYVVFTNQEGRKRQFENLMKEILKIQGRKGKRKEGKGKRGKEKKNEEPKEGHESNASSTCSVH